jgi:isopenicillin-N epimerase
MTEHPLSRHWRLDPDIIYLNHGSFGACPAAVLDAQREYRDRMEAEAVTFFMRDLFELLDRSRTTLAPVIGADPADIVFMPNATTAVATVVHNLLLGLGPIPPLGPGDELLACSHEYAACLHILRDAARRSGATLRIVDLPVVPTDGPMTQDRFEQALLEAVTDRTRLCLLSLITSPTALVTPAGRIIAELERRGVLTLLDAAHGPGAIPLDLRRLRPAFFTTNAHKWLCAPKGAAVMTVRSDLQEHFMPMALSVYEQAPAGHLARSKFALSFDYVGTDDYTPHIAIADAVEHLPAIAGTDWTGITRRNRDLALAGRDLLLGALRCDKTATDDMVGPMAVVPLPPPPAAPRPTIYGDALQDALVTRHRIQVPVWRAAPASESSPVRWLRLSAQLYNTIDQYHALAEALVQELASERKGS